MTLLVACEAIEAGDVDSTDVYTIPAWLADTSKVTGGRLNVLQNEMYTLWDMMHLSYGQSYNDITFGIADHVTGGVDGWQGPGSATVGTFVDMMNDKATALGMNNTMFTNPAGRPWEDPYSTPDEMAKLMRAAIQNPIFRDLANDRTWTTDFTDSNGNPAKMTLNSSFRSFDDAYGAANAYKPGGNDQSQRTGIFSARSNFLGTVIGTAFGWRRADPAESWANRSEDMANLLKLAFTGCGGQPVVPAPPPPGPTLSVPSISTELGVTSAHGAPGEGADGDDLEVILIRQSGTDAISMHVAVRRSSERNFLIGTPVAYSLGPVVSHDGYEITNIGVSLASLSVTLSAPTNVFSVLLNPNETFTVSPATYSVPTPVTMSIEHTGTETATLAVQELGYHADVSSLRGELGDVIFQQTLARGGSGNVDDVILIELEGMDRAGSLVWLLLQQPGLPTDAAELPLVPGRARMVLHPNVPNPFNPATTIRYWLASPQRVDLRIFDASGRLVRILDEGTREAGIHRVVWDGRTQQGGHVASGVYFYTLRAGGETRSSSMVLVR
jgi:hypothetical protein